MMLIRPRPGSKNQKPKVDTQIDFHGLLLKDAEKRLPGMVEDKLRRLLR